MFVMSNSYNTTFNLALLLKENLTDLIIPNNYFNRITSLVLSNNTELKRIVIGDDCFKYVRVVELDSLMELESLVIGKKSFRIDDSKRSDGTCRIVNCPKLKSITVDRDSFDDYNILELKSLPSLHSIDVKYGSYYRIRSFSLTGLID